VPWVVDEKIPRQHVHGQSPLSPFASAGHSPRCSPAAVCAKF
jgi:hypothetical protein